MLVTGIKRDISIENADICILIRYIAISYIDTCNLNLYRYFYYIFLYFKWRYLILGVNRDIST